MVKEYRPSNGTLEDIQEHLEYEIRMLFETASALQSFTARSSSDPGAWCVHNALLEAFLIHARILIDFLYPPQSSKKDDVFAKHFLDDPAIWSREHSITPQLLQKVRERAHKEVAHLTYKRASIGSEDKRWLFIRTAQSLGSVLEDFVGLASPAKVSKSLVQIITKYVDQIESVVFVEATDSTTSGSGVSVTCVPISPNSFSVGPDSFPPSKEGDNS